MEQDLQILQGIQAWDREIYQLRETLDEIPSELAEANRHCEEERRQLQKLQGDLKSLQLKQREKEAELDSKEEHIRKYEAQLTQVKTNKEYASLQSEMISLKADNSLLEETIINLIDQVEDIQRNVEAQKKRLLESETVLAQKKMELEEKTNVILGKIDVLTKQKREKIKEVDPEVASLYEQIVVKKRGLALVKIEDEVCPACQIQLRPQVVNEVKLKEKVTLCDNCSRILYSE